MAQWPGPPGLSTGPGSALRTIGSRRWTRWAAALRADPLSAAVTVLAGLFGVAQILLSWTAIVFSVSLPADGGVSGWQIFQTARSAASFSLTSAVGAYSVLGVALTGGAMVLLGLAMLAPLDHRPLGLTALACSVISTAGAAWWLLQARSLTNRGLGDVFAYAGPGWYLFLLAGPVGIAGSVKALTAG